MSNTFQSGTINQEFLDRLNQNNQQSNLQNVNTMSIYPPNNELPPTVVLPPSNNNEQQTFDLFPSSYDLRTYNRVSPVKNQGAIGSCWAFATYGSLESTLLPSTLTDFSENNLINKHGFDLGPNDGGNEQMSSAYLLRWSGPINEDDDPYTGVVHPSPDGLLPSRHVQEIRLIKSRTSPLDNDNIKQNIMNYGAMHCSIGWYDVYYNAATFSYYNNGNSNTNHGVTVIGWDDNYPKEKFLVVPPENGAFLVKNSWGTSFGDNGYFYISYYDVSFQPRAIYRRAETVNNYSSIYQYDNFGFLNSFWYIAEPEFAYGSNVFTATKNEYIKAVGFYTVCGNTQCIIEIYKNCINTPTSGTLVSTKNYGVAICGYQTVDLDSEVMVSAGEKFSVVITFITPGSTPRFCCEWRYAGYSSGVTINSGESFVSTDKNNWFDIIGAFSEVGNLCIKAYTRGTLVLPTVYVDAPDNIVTICS
ncbi:MAG: lectin like domain-containing protein, partial [Clostridium sp.]